MRKYHVPIIAAATLALGACATSPYSQYGGNPYGGAGAIGALIGALGSGGGYGGYGTSGYGSTSFQQAAVNACGSTASRYGQVGIRDARQVSSSTVRVYGVVSNGYSSRNWDCDFRSDGRITDFDI